MDLGAEPGPEGTTFRVRSAVARRVELCLFDETGAEADRVALDPVGDGTWAATVAVGAGQRYGYRVEGPADRQLGHGCDPAKLLVDPAARRVEGELRWHADLLAPGRDSAPHVPRSVVVPAAAAARLASPRPWNDTFVYEAHVGHLTARHPDVEPAHRGRYLGLAAPAVIAHLQQLGVTAIELLPVQHFVSEPDLVAAGERNVWGYNPLAWGAPHAGYATEGGDPVAELRAAVGALHDAGIEVWLDVVFNHTAEGALGTGPTLSWRGFDNAGWYRKVHDRAGWRDENLSGCGNAIDTRPRANRQLITQLLVRWVRELGIDGFRFDLAATLIRVPGASGTDRPSRDAPLLRELADEPGLDGVRMVAEPWDLGPDGYAPGRFPAPWRVWNDRFRDDVRRRWAGEGTWGDVAPRLAGSRDLFDGPARGHDATAGINAVVTHDGKTLADLESDPATRRALLASLLVAQGVPMISSGDELGRTQGGVRDGYRLEPARWGLDWSATGPAGRDDLRAWLGAAVAAWHRHPVLRRDAWVLPGDEAIVWRTPAGAPMSDEQWRDPDLGGLLVEWARSSEDGAALVLFVRADPVDVELPAGQWRPVIDSRSTAPLGDAEPIADRHLSVAGPAVVVLVDAAHEATR